MDKYWKTINTSFTIIKYTRETAWSYYNIKEKESVWNQFPKSFVPSKNYYRIFWFYLSDYILIQYSSI